MLLDEQLQNLKRIAEDGWRERSELRRQCDELRAELNRSARGGTAALNAAPPGLPRHIRRQLERQQRRRAGS